MLVGLLTGGGDCPGLNAVIRAVVAGSELTIRSHPPRLRTAGAGCSIKTTSLDLTRSAASFRAAARSWAPRAPTRTRTRAAGRSARRLPGAGDRRPDRRSAARTRSASRPAHRAVRGPVRRRPQDDRQRPRRHRLHVRLPTAVQVATDAIDRLHSTAESHDRVMVVEVMGRHVGLDRHVRGSGRWRRRDPDPGGRLGRWTTSVPRSCRVMTGARTSRSSW